MTKRAARKGQTHDRILESARAIVRREGLRAASVTRVMEGAGLTIGGFYAHFPSKASMDAEVVRSLLGTLPGPWLAGLDNASGLTWVAHALDRYLSKAHRDHPKGCAYPAVLSEVAAGSPALRLAFADALELRVRAFEAQLPESSAASARERALATMALTIGGLLLAKASAGSPLSNALLAACRTWALPEATPAD